MARGARSHATEWGDRVNEIDIRIAKILRLKGTRTNIGFDIDNLVNSDAVLNDNTAFIPGKPRTRLIKPSGCGRPLYTGNRSTS